MNWDLLIVVIGSALINGVCARLMIRFYMAEDDAHNLGRAFGDAYWRRVNRSDEDDRR